MAISKRNLLIVTAAVAFWLLPLSAKAQNLLGEFLQCVRDNPITDRSPCNWFAGKAIEKIWNVKDFQRPNKPGEYLLANEIADFVASSRCWARLGTADDDLALERQPGTPTRGSPLSLSSKPCPMVMSPW